MAATVFPAPSASQLTDQGGQVVLARFKSGDVAITSTQLPAGNYFVTAQGSGALQIFSYTNSNLGSQIKSIVVNGSTTTQISVLAGYTGLVFTGDYDGPLVFQTIANASSVLLSAASVAITDTYSDFTGSIWRPITNSPFMITWSSGYSTIVNIDTGVSVTTQAGGTRPVYAYSPVFITGDYDTLYGYNPSTGTIIFANGYGQGNYNSVIYRSTNQGLSWTAVTTLTDTYAYWSIADFVGSNFYITCGWTGTSQTRRLLYVSTNDGASWTFLDLSIYAANNSPLTKILYSPIANRYIATSIPPGAQSTPQQSMREIWNLGSSGTSLVSYYTPPSTPGGQSYSNAGYIPANDVHSGRFIIVDNLGTTIRSDDGLAWVNDFTNTSGVGSMRRYGQNYTASAIGILGGQLRFIATGNDTNGYQTGFIFDGNGGRQNTYWASLPWNINNAANYLEQVSPQPITGNRRMMVARKQTGSGLDVNRLVVEINNGFTTPSGFSGLYPPQGFRAHYSVKNDLFLFNSSTNQRLYSNNSAKPRVVPSDLIWNDTGAKDFAETSNGTILVLSSTQELFRSTNGTSWAQQQLNQSWLGLGRNIATLNNTVIISRGTNNQIYVSSDAGQSFFLISMPSTGNASDTAWRVASNEKFFFATANATGQVWSSTDGLVWTYTNQSGQANGFIWKAGGHLFTDPAAGNSTISRIVPNTSAIVSFTHPNSAISYGFYQFGSEIAMIPILNSGQNTSTFYTSSNGSSWTARSNLSNRRWMSSVGHPAFTIAFASDDSVGEKISTTRTVTVQ